MPLTFIFFAIASKPIISTFFQHNQKKKSQKVKTWLREITITIFVVVVIVATSEAACAMEQMRCHNYGFVQGNLKIKVEQQQAL